MCTWPERRAAAERGRQLARTPPAPARGAVWLPALGAPWPCSAAAAPEPPGATSHKPARGGWAPAVPRARGQGGAAERASLRDRGHRRARPRTASCKADSPASAGGKKPDSAATVETVSSDVIPRHPCSGWGPGCLPPSLRALSSPAAVTPRPHGPSHRRSPQLSPPPCQHPG